MTSVVFRTRLHGMCKAAYNFLSLQVVTVNFVLQAWAQKRLFSEHSLLSPEGAAPRTVVSRLGSRAQPRQSLAHSAREGCSGQVFRVEMDAAVEPAGV